MYWLISPCVYLPFGQTTLSLSFYCLCRAITGLSLYIQPKPLNAMPCFNYALRQSMLSYHCTRLSVGIVTVCSFMGRSVIDFPVSTIAAVLQNLENFRIWNKYMTVRPHSPSLSAMHQLQHMGSMQEAPPTCKPLAQFPEPLDPCTSQNSILQQYIMEVQWSAVRFWSVESTEFFSQPLKQHAHFCSHTCNTCPSNNTITLPLLNMHVYTGYYGTPPPPPLSTDNNS